MKKCAHCEAEIPTNKRTDAIFCSKLCRIKAHRRKHNIPEPFSKGYVTDNVFDGQKVKSFTCCANGRFYSPLGQWGETLICDTCGARWQKINKR